MSSTMLQIGILALVIALGSIYFLFAGRRADERRRARFAHREDLSFDAFYRQYYQDSDLDADSVQRALDQVAGALNVPIGKLRPDDRFAVELAPQKGWELDDGAGLLGQVVRNKGAAAGAQQIRTLDDFIRVAASTS
jgi:hypothetical protein